MKSDSVITTGFLMALIMDLGAGCGAKKDSGSDGNGGDPGAQPSPNDNNPTGAPTADSIQVGVSAGSLAIRTDPASLALIADRILQEAANLTTTSAKSDEYPGMGINYGEAVVDGFKIRLTGVGMGTGLPGQPGGFGISLFNWADAPKELEISAGLSSSVTDSKATVVNAGVYTHATMSIQRNFDIKAFAYMDADANGVIDTTIYTKSTGVVKVASVISHANLATDKSLGYDYYHYDFIYQGPREDPNPMENFSSPFVTPISICETSKTPAQAPTNNGSGPTSTGASGLAPECTDVSKLRVDLLIDTMRVVKAWDGRYGNDHASPVLPQVGMPFPNGPTSTNGATYGFKAGEPAFGLLYLPAFAFVGTENSGAGGVSSETYMLSEVDPTDVHFKVAQTYRLSVVFDASGKPIVGKALGNTPDLPVYVGMAARVFEPDASQAGFYSFYTGGTGVGPGGDPSKSDGGLDYNIDKTMAGHRFDGFKSIATIGQTLMLKQYDALRCDARSVEKKMHEDMNNPLTCGEGDAAACAADPLYAYKSYNHCVEFRKQVDTSLAADFGVDSAGKTYRKVYMTRVK